jgi:hypothetical protein
MPAFAGVLVLSLAASLAAERAEATVVFDNFGPENAVDSSGWVVGGLASENDPNLNFTQAFLFSPSASGLLSSVSAAIYASSIGTSGQLTLHIWSDLGGVPGTDLESVTLNLPLMFVGSPFETIAMSGTTQLLASQSYWLGFSGLHETFGIWRNSPGASGPGAHTSAAGQDWTVFPAGVGAFRVEVQGVPEPGTFALMTVGLVGLLWARRRQQSLRRYLNLAP